MEGNVESARVRALIELIARAQARAWAATSGERERREEKVA